MMGAVFFFGWVRDRNGARIPSQMSHGRQESRLAGRAGAPTLTYLPEKEGCTHRDQAALSLQPCTGAVPPGEWNLGPGGIGTFFLGPPYQG